MESHGHEKGQPSKKSLTMCLDRSVRRLRWKPEGFAVAPILVARPINHVGTIVQEDMRGVPPPGVNLSMRGEGWETHCGIYVIVCRLDCRGAPIDAVGLLNKT